MVIKLLPERFVEDEERLQRFEREARSLASRYHRNVAQLFGVDQVDDTCFMVMELVPGDGLGAVLADGPLPVREAMDGCRRIADGLEVAHETGVIHRDLEPANVRVTPAGVATLLDFGLATSSRRPEGGSDTDSVFAAESGCLLGTPAFMAPVQARRKPVDGRVDVEPSAACSTSASRAAAPTGARRSAICSPQCCTRCSTSRRCPPTRRRACVACWPTTSTTTRATACATAGG